MAPNKHDIQVATDALRADAQIWLTGAGDLDKVQSLTRNLAFNPIQAGVFQLLVNAHTELVTAVQDRCGEGTDETHRIASAVHRVADTYDDEERLNEHALRNLY